MKDLKVKMVPVFGYDDYRYASDCMAKSKED